MCSNVVYYSELCAVLNLATSVAAHLHPVQNSTSFITRTNDPHVKLDLNCVDVYLRVLCTPLLGVSAKWLYPHTV